LGDLISRRLVKALVMRPRPHFIDQICTQPYCWGFVSSHSTNVTAAMTVLCLYNRRYLVFAVPIVFLVSTSRVYLQDHYFLDVLGGVGLGFFIGLAVWEVLKLVLKAKFLKTSESPPY
jgi:membrane-associated phospholipid phosphatase